MQPAALLKVMVSTARRIHPGLTPIALWRAASLLHHQLRWFTELRAWHDPATKALNSIVRQRPSIVCAVSRPYINTEWSSARRLRAIRMHYTLLSEPLKLLDFDSSSRVTIAGLTIGAHPLSFVIDMPEWFAHEGELALNLFSEGRRVYSLVFSLGEGEDGLTAYVGALQGMRDADARAIYRQLTHLLHGLRPRELLLAAFRMLCARLGVLRMLAVSDRCRPSANDYFDNRRAVFTSYDAVWREHGGTLVGEGFFELPLTLTRRGPDTVPGRKRAQYRRRYAMLDALAREVAQGIDQRRRT